MKIKKKLEPTITKPEIQTKKSKPNSDKSEAKIKIHEPFSNPHEPTTNKLESRLKSPRQKFRRPPDKYIIDLHKYEILLQPNCGVLGFISFVKNKETNKQYAIKTSFSNFISTNQKLISHDINLLIRINNPTIIKLKGFSYTDFQGNNNITILMEYLGNCSLSELIEKIDSSHFQTDYNNTKRQIILIGIAYAMMILHKHHIIHYDLKPENVLLDNNYRPRITDFGLSRIFNAHKKLISDITTAPYIAPETIQSGHFSTKTDVYSFGILMFELISNSRVYKNYFENQEFDISSFHAQVTNGLRPEINFPIKKGMKTMIEKCWSNDPDERPTFSELFAKLSLSDEDRFMEFGVEDCKITINSEDENDDRMNYCLDEVNIDELFMYVDEILEDKKSPEFRYEEIEKLVEINREQAKSINDQKNKISYLIKYVSLLKEDNSKIKEENSQLSKDISRLTADISQLKDQLPGQPQDNFQPRSRNFRMNDEIAPQSSQNSQKTDEFSTNASNEEDKGQINAISAQLTEDNKVSKKEVKMIYQQSNESSKHEEKNDQENKETSEMNNERNPEEINQKETRNGSENEEDISDDHFLQKLKNGTITVAEIPSSYSCVPDNMFKFFHKLEEVKIPSSVTSIGSDSFYECTSLLTVTIPASVTSIGDYAFCRCTLLSSVSFPKSLKSIGSHAFSRCLSLGSVELPESIDTIKEGAFSGCSSLLRVKIPASLAAIEDCTFFGCSGLRKVDIPESIRTIGYDAFYKCSSLQKVVVPASVESIGKGAFNGCLSLEKVEFEKNSKLDSIKEYTFFECLALTRIEIPPSVKLIGPHAFGECEALASVKVPSSVSSVAGDAFSPKTKLI